jgi:hypothetical protein
VQRLPMALFRCRHCTFGGVGSPGLGQQLTNLQRKAVNKIHCQSSNNFLDLIKV